ncbi:hypothetical protein FHL15_006103 [Xylaria flabelliformis]|uniref:DUF6590 domain-containing protein n=1 Tax=Xylaria flabelliformis TaxID=2512241 RepID=A0A553HYD4_9PEZI|nr:hypothetical protein FHL15_006103 [Xylaria flabelliformis]
MLPLTASLTSLMACLNSRYTDTCDRASSVKETLGSPLSVGPPSASHPLVGGTAPRTKLCYDGPPSATGYYYTALCSRCGTGNNAASIERQPIQYTLSRLEDATGRRRMKQHLSSTWTNLSSLQGPEEHAVYHLVYLTQRGPLLALLRFPRKPIPVHIAIRFSHGPQVSLGSVLRSCLQTTTCFILEGQSSLLGHNQKAQSRARSRVEPAAEEPHRAFKAKTQHRLVTTNSWSRYDSCHELRLSRVDYYSNDKAGLQNGTMHGKKYPAKNSHSQSWGAWSDWKWDQTQQKYYCERLDRQGHVEYMWDSSWDNGGVTTNDHQRTPRTEATIDQLTTGIGGLDVNSSGYGHNRDIPYQEQNNLPIDHSTPDIPASPLYTHDTYYDDSHGYSPSHSHSHSHRDKGKGVSHSSSHDVHYNEGHNRLGSISSTTNSYSQDDYPQRSVPGQEDYGRTSSSSYYPQPGDHDDYELQQALKNSRDEILGNSRAGGPSTSGAHYDSGSIYPGTYDLNPTGPGDSETTPRGTPVPPRSEIPSSDYVDTSIIRGTPGTVEPIDHQNSYKFQPGEVFKILWSEPTGQVAGDAPISDIRAMSDSGGVRPSKHGIIYAVGQKPKLLRNEPELGFEPVPLEIYAEGETLARESRVNYSKLVTIEHNVKVFFIGRISYPYFDWVSSAVDKCWNDKMQKPTVTFSIEEIVIWQVYWQAQVNVKRTYAEPTAAGYQDIFEDRLP